MTKEEFFGIIIEKPDDEAYKKAKSVFDSLAKPIDGLGLFEHMICTIASNQRTDRPDISSRGLVIMIADNGVTAEGVSQTSADVTLSVARLMGMNKSTVGVMAENQKFSIIPVDIGIDYDQMIPGVIDKKVAKGTGSITTEPAMSEADCLLAIERGMSVADMCNERGIKIVATAEMGIGNTTTSSALLCALSGRAPVDVTGRGAGLSDEGLQTKTHVIERSLRYHKLNNTNARELTPAYALHALSCVGGLDIAGLTGLYTRCAQLGITTVIDGLISAVAALVAVAVHPMVKGYLLASHSGKEKGCRMALDMLGLSPAIDADLAVGEGTGAVMLFPLLDMVMNVYNNGTVFADTDIAQYKRFDR